MRKSLLLLAFGGLIAAGVAHARCRAALAEAERSMKELATRSVSSSAPAFDPAMVAPLPEIARRYFSHAIRTGTLLRPAVRLSMEGAFLLGDRHNFQEYEMEARQVLAPPSEFVWIPKMSAGLMRISGSDALAAGAAWTRFWMNGLIPVADIPSSPDLIRSALARAAMEAVWAPASLLPPSGVQWEQPGPDRARVHFPTGVEPVEITLDQEGRVVELATMRWSDANPDKVFRLQPFGGGAEAEAEFGGFTIPSQISVGNHFGTAEYLPFFQARLTAAEYL